MLHQQPPLGNGDQGCYAEVSQPHEPQRDRCGRFGQKRRQTGSPPQPKTPQHRVGSSIHREIREFLKTQTLPAGLAPQKKLLQQPWRSCVTLSHMICVCVTLNGKMWPVVHVCAPDLHVVPATVGIRSAWITSIDSFIKNQLMLLCGVECDLHPQVYSSPEVVVEVCLTGVNDQFMARCHSSCCSGHHSGIAVVAEVSPQTARDVTFRLRRPHFKPGGQWNDRLWRTRAFLCNMSCEPPPCDDRLNIMRIRREIDFVTVNLKDADAF